MSGQSVPGASTGKKNEPKGFDDFELTLGDIMRGERATLSKSLMDVHRDLRIKAAYIAAIENADPSAFDTPGFIAGYVRSYARYLGLDPEWAYETFCRESGFETSHGMSAQASTLRSSRDERLAARREGADMFVAPEAPYMPRRESVLSQVEPRALMSIAVLATLVAGLAYGSWAVIQEVQRVEFAPIETAPQVASVIGTTSADFGSEVTALDVEGTGALAAIETAAIDRLYRPQALDVPIIASRDAPISSLNPDHVGAFARYAADQGNGVPVGGPVQVLDGPAPEVILVAVEPTWVRVQTPDQSIVFEKTLGAGERYAIPVTEETPVLRADNAGSIYFQVNGNMVGPAGRDDSPIRGVELAALDLSAAYAPADPIEDAALFDLLRSLDAPDVLPIVADTSAQTVTLVAREEAWVQVKDVSTQKVVFEGILPPEGTYEIPQGFEDLVLWAGNSGALYLSLGDKTYGPMGKAGRTIRDVSLRSEAVSERFDLVQ